MLLAFGFPASARAQAEAELWTFSASLRETFASNLFLASGGGSSDSITGATVSLGYGHTSPRNAFGATGWVSGSFLGRYSRYNNVPFGLGASAQLGLTHRARLRLGGGYADGLNVESPYTTPLGLPGLDVKSGSLSTGLTYSISPSSSADASLDGFWLRYRATATVPSSALPVDTTIPTDVLAPLLGLNPPPLVPSGPDESLQTFGLLALENLEIARLDYESWHAGLGFSHEFAPRTRGTIGFGYRKTYQQPNVSAEGEQLESQVALQQVLGPTANLSLSYSYQDNRFLVSVKTHSLTAQADKQLGRKVKLDGTLGASYLDGPSDASSGWTLVGGGGVSARFRRSLLAARYVRTRYQALISGRNEITNVVYASIGHTFGKRVFSSAFGYYRNAHDQVQQGYSYDVLAGGLSLSVRIKRRTSAGLSASYLRLENRPLPASGRWVVSLSLGYSRTQK